MKIQVLSDLHFEFHPDRGRAFVDSLDPSIADVLVLAGDIATGDLLLDALKLFKEKFEHVVFVAGNHEYYGCSVNDLLEIRYAVHRDLLNIYWLERGTVRIEGVGFIGTTLWFDDLGGRKNNLSDFRAIRDFEPWVYKEFRLSRAFLHRNTRTTDVVITHHLPSYRSVAKKFESDPLNCFFVSDVEDTIRERQPKLWIHGHTHASCDYNIGETHVVCNPYGYDGREVNPEFRKDFVVEVGR